MKQNKLAVLLIITGIIWTSYNYVNKEEKKYIENNKITYTLLDQSGYLKKDADIYNMIIEIPKINLKKGIYDKNDERNNINQNITIHEKSDYPDSENSNLILMAHSGNGEVAYFNELTKLDTDSLVKVYYNNVKYVYRIDNIYDILKGQATTINRDLDKNTITLVTCNQKDKTKQTVYIGYLIDKI